MNSVTLCCVCPPFVVAQHRFQRALANLMPERNSIAQTRRDFRNCLIQHARALTSANHQHADRAFAPLQPLRRQRQRQHVGAHRVAHHLGVRERAREGLHHFGGDARQPAVGQAGDAVLLVQHHRDAALPSRQAAGAGNVTAHPQHHIRLIAAHDGFRLAHRLPDPQRRSQLGLQAFAAQAGDADKINLDPVLRHQIGFHSVCGSEPAHLPALRHQMMRDRQPREHVPAGTACHHH